MVGKPLTYEQIWGEPAGEMPAEDPCRNILDEQQEISATGSPSTTPGAGSEDTEKNKSS